MVSKKKIVVAVITAAAKMNAAIWNNILYVTSKFSKNAVPSSGPIIKPITKNIVNHEIFFTLFFSVLSFEIMASHGGQKNA